MYIQHADICVFVWSHDVFFPDYFSVETNGQRTDHSMARRLILERVMGRLHRGGWGSSTLPDRRQHLTQFFRGKIVSFLVTYDDLFLSGVAGSSDKQVHPVHAIHGLELYSRQETAIHWCKFGVNPQLSDQPLKILKGNMMKYAQQIPNSADHITPPGLRVEFKIYWAQQQIWQAFPGSAEMDWRLRETLDRNPMVYHPNASKCKAYT